MGAVPRPRMGLPLALLLITTMMAAACGTSGNGGAATVAPSASMEELVAAATKEGKITIYSAQGLDALNNLAAAFKAQYPGIEVEVVRGVDGELGVKVETELQTKGIADMYVSASLPWVQAQATAGSFLEPVGPELTGKGAYDAKQYVHDGNYFETNAAVLTFGWNTNATRRACRTTRTSSTPRSAAGRSA